ncbi:MAG: arsenite S-adenosylmethyltransferase [Planctomycetes bacterium]|jgi:SAM-dependent methyltransferase|nr:arsenite S-adenosylmethyltransferase [Planctomycetota bacterium]MDP6425070.1 arsenite methyltransferase [Planctomycetota bacterium]
MSHERERIHGIVRDSYARIAEETPVATDTPSGCSPAADCCGGGGTQKTVGEVAGLLGYTEEELRDLPGGANLGLGCGNPHALAALSAGEVVLDLGSGGGVDCFIAAKRVGNQGRVIGVDMTPAMLARSRDLARESGYDNVEFRLGEIEHLPIADGTVHVILSNCVVNLSPDKEQVLREAFRVLVPGGRLAISDVIATCDLPAEIREDDALLSGCIAGAETQERLEQWLGQVGFTSIEIRPWDESREFIREWAPGRAVEDFVVSAMIAAQKPV